MTIPAVESLHRFSRHPRVSQLVDILNAARKPFGELVGELLGEAGGMKGYAHIVLQRNYSPPTPLIPA